MQLLRICKLDFPKLSRKRKYFKRIHIIIWCQRHTNEPSCSYHVNNNLNAAIRFCHHASTNGTSAIFAVYNYNRVWSPYEAPPSLIESYSGRPTQFPANRLAIITTNLKVWKKIDQIFFHFFDFLSTQMQIALGRMFVDHFIIRTKK